jgi:hypothetical protein
VLDLRPKTARIFPAHKVKCWEVEASTVRVGGTMASSGLTGRKKNVPLERSWVETPRHGQQAQAPEPQAPAVQAVGQGTSDQFNFKRGTIDHMWPWPIYIFPISNYSFDRNAGHHIPC